MLLLELCFATVVGVLLARCEQFQILVVVVRDTYSRARSTGRLYVKGVMMGFKRGLRNQHEDTVILKVHNVADAGSTQFYLGKRVCYIYK